MESTLNNQDLNECNILLQNPGEQVRPQVTFTDAIRLVLEEFGLDVLRVQKLLSYEDQNFFVQVLPVHFNPHIHSLWPYGYLLKVLNSLESQRPEFVVAQNELLFHLHSQKFGCPLPVANLNGFLYTEISASPGVMDEISAAQTQQKRQHIVRLLTFIPGEILSEIPSNVETLFEVGSHLAKLHEAMKGFHHPAFELRRTVWSLDCLSHLKKYLHAVHDQSHQALVHDVLKNFEDMKSVTFPHLPQGLIHGDYNEQNILMQACSEDGNSAAYKVCGVLDYADVQWSCLVFDVAIGLMYMMTDWKGNNPILAGGHFLAGYIHLHRLNEQEWDVLKVCVAARFCQSLVMGAYTRSLDPNNDYLLTTQKNGWKLLSEIWTLPKTTLYNLWKNVILNH